LRFVFKILGFALMVVAPFISGRALYEYASVKWMNQKPSYPFGKALSKALHSTHIDFLSGYQHEMLSIGLVFLAISILAYLAMLVKTLFNLIKLALIATLVYLIYLYL
jgi:hypothetical protein